MIEWSAVVVVVEEEEEEEENIPQLLHPGQLYDACAELAPSESFFPHEAHVPEILYSAFLDGLDMVAMMKRVVVKDWLLRIDGW